ncbi:TPA: hypothetical protein OB783_004849 [Escherichia coli]|nr:hypothetical protein [Escherichia coli]HCO8305555.1 hypothetical protein [Escherichia coli]HCO8314650.1 hypothetical protein [Escherichia coli]HCO8414401.1 hypothetical protein [Escherichia coli]
MSIISEPGFYKLIKTKSAPLPERPCEQLTCCEKNGSVQGNYINRVTKRHNCRITGKTKATRYGGPSTQATRYPQRMSITDNATFAAGGQCDQCAGLLVDYQPFGSIPRCCNSLRIIRFIQAARESSPSCCCAFSIFSRKSGSKRNWNGGLPRLSFLCVDTLITPHVMYLCVMTHYTQSAQKAKPRKCRYHWQGL